MKQIILAMTIMLAAIGAMAQMNAALRTAKYETMNAPGYEAANWKTWLLDDPQQITIAAPPGVAQTKAELQILKQGIPGLHDKKNSSNQILECRRTRLSLEPGFTRLC